MSLATADNTMVALRNIHAGYSGVPVIRDVNFSVRLAEIFVIVGANGAGKSTLLRVIAGLHRPMSGSVTLSDPRSSGSGGKRGSVPTLALVPEGRRIFPHYSVRDNLLIGAGRQRIGRVELERRIADVYAKFGKLSDRKDQSAGTMSGGEQQMLAIGMGLMARPSLLLLDEPSLGLAPVIVNDVFHEIVKLKDSGVTVILVEQRAQQAMEIADRGVVITNGTIVAEGRGSELAEDPRVRDAYLGSE